MEGSLRNKSALFFDIDGTIISEITHEIPSSTVAAMRKARENGHLLFLNTGRTYCCISPELRALPVDGCLCGCGTYLVYRDEILYEHHIPRSRANEIVKKAFECRIEGVFEGVNDVYLPAGTSRFSGLEYLRRGMNSAGLAMKRYLEQGDCLFDKMYIFSDEQSDLQTFFDFISEDMEIIDRRKGNYECVPLGCSKATAIQRILDRFGMDLDQAYVFGDSGNDLPMFRLADHTIAMGQHDPVLDEYTEFVTKTVEEDGIEYAMKHYHLI